MNKTELRTELSSINKTIQKQNQTTLYNTGNAIEDDYADMEIYIQLLEEKIAILLQLL